jgi:phosphopantothenoylcysteine decarboxylase/phosphopantothenate--cysteine ligase
MLWTARWARTKAGPGLRKTVDFAIADCKTARQPGVLNQQSKINNLKSMKVALGVTGGIAAYKAAEIIRLLQEKDHGIRVQVVMTRAAQEFVRPLTFAALSGEKVITGMFSPGEEHKPSLDSSNIDSPNIDSAIEHISVAQSIDALLVAPATADVLAHFAQGIASDFLTTLYLATTAPVVVAPAMNVNMWNHPATQTNLQLLRQRGVKIVEPGAGYLACGMTGAGRLAENETIVAAVMEALGASQDLSAETVLITSGPTREKIDPVRYLTNRSSGRMGYALAEAALRRGARVLLVSGPTSLTPPGAAEITPVESAEEMRDAVFQLLPHATIVIKTAAVSDYRPKAAAAQKIKRKGPMTLELEATPDILKELSLKKSAQLIVGFAAETENVLENARQKLVAKNLDAIVVNDVSREGVGFDSDRNAVTIITHDQVVEVPETTKRAVAQRVLDQVVRLRQHRKSPVKA